MCEVQDIRIALARGVYFVVLPLDGIKAYDFGNRVGIHDALFGEAPQGGAAGGEDQEVVRLREEEASEREAEP